ncbi:MAG: hypothetical protein FJW40_17405 [Acidobacteria bacterium]|nr:hypothetical protein [Acidobacteriota bacterium]
MNERRGKTRRTVAGDQYVRVQQHSHSGQFQETVARVLDVSDGGMRIEMQSRPQAGTRLFVSGAVLEDGRRTDFSRWCEVVWSKSLGQGSFAVGLQAGAAQTGQTGGAAVATSDAPDYYEAMQLSSKADPDTIHRVYRLLAQRYHPDNPETGSSALFRELNEAYHTLSDPERRTAYDLRWQASKQLRWKIFERPESQFGLEGEKAKRGGILAVLYNKRLREPAQPAVTMRQFEDLLGCPLDHLEFALWYLREKGWIQRGDSGRYTITLAGVEQSENAGVRIEPAMPLLPAAA